MFKRSFGGHGGGSGGGSGSGSAAKEPANKITKPLPPLRRELRRSARHKDMLLRDATVGGGGARGGGSDDTAMAGSPNLLSSIATMVVGPEQRLFAAHEHVLAQAPFFAAVLRDQMLVDAHARRIVLPDEEPEVLSCVLEFLYKGDYYPALVADKKRPHAWVLEGAATTEGGGGRTRTSTSAVEPTLVLARVGDVVLRDTAVYCAAGRYGLAELQRLALRKQGLQAGIDVATILRSARYAYAHTPDHDSRLRAHYLALIVRSRRTFKRSGTMQLEMEQGGTLFFDLFVAMCNHIDDIVDATNSRSPRTI